MKTNPRKPKKRNLKSLHNYYSYTGFYKYLNENIKKSIWPIVGVIVSLILFDRYVFDVKEGLSFITENFSEKTILLIFFISESVLGLIPPDLFIAWAEFQSNPFLMLFILAVLSYLGGVLSYWQGVGIASIPSIKSKMDTRFAESIRNTRRWGGFLIIVGALLPLPFSPASLVAGFIGYPHRLFLRFALFRFLRFAIYGLALFSFF